MQSRFGSLEARVIDAVWQATDPVTVRQVQEQLNEHPSAGRPLAYTTVMTVLDNLRTKGWVERELDGRAYRYTASTTKDEAAATLMREALSTSDDRQSALLHFTSQLSAEESSALRKALNRIARRRS